MPRGFLVKRSRRPSPISYRSRCCCFPDEQEAAPRILVLPPPLPQPHFGTPEGEEEEEEEGEEGLRLKSRVPPEPPLLLGPGGELKLWAVAPAGPPAPPAAPLPAPAPLPRSQQGASKRPQGRKGKAARRLHFEDEVTTSPVLGLRIKEGPPEGPHPPHQHPPPPLGEFICQLCKERYPDPLALAQHKCSRIVRVEYRCPECDKLFSCPANLASHRRWHKPRGTPPAPAAAAKAAKAAPAAPPVPPPPAAKRSSERDTPSPGEEEEEEDEEEAEEAVVKGFRRPKKHPQHQQHQTLEEEVDGVPLSPGSECHRCPVCGEAFPSKSGQERHLRLLHAAQAFPCKYCPATFYSSPGLTRHINKCHPSENRQVILLQLPLRPAC